jgi:hypothetical protein
MENDSIELQIVGFKLYYRFTKDFTLYHPQTIIYEHTPGAVVQLRPFALWDTSEDHFRIHLLQGVSLPQEKNYVSLTRDTIELVSPLSGCSGSTLSPNDLNHKCYRHNLLFL